MGILRRVLWPQDQALHGGLIVGGAVVWLVVAVVVVDGGLGV